MPIALRSSSRTEAIIVGRNHDSRTPSRTRATYSFIDQSRLAAACLSQATSLNDSRKETTGFSSDMGVLVMAPPGDLRCTAPVYYRSTTWQRRRPRLETAMATRLDRWLDRAFS